MKDIRSTTGILKLLRELADTCLVKVNLQDTLQKFVEHVGERLDLERCTVLLFDQWKQEIVVQGEYCPSKLPSVLGRQYHLDLDSELYALLADGKPIPLSELEVDTPSAKALPEFDRYKYDSESKTLIAFPFTKRGKFLGCLCLHLDKGQPFSEDLFEAGEFIAVLLSLAIEQAGLVEQLELDGQVFRFAQFPLLLVDRNQQKIVDANGAADLIFETNFRGRDLNFLSTIFAPNQAQEICQALTCLSAQDPLQAVSALVCLKPEPATFQALVSLLENEQKALLAFLPVPERISTLKNQTAKNETTNKLEQYAASLAKQLSWEKAARQISCKLHASRDRDLVLQTVVDSLGQMLGATHCLLIRTEGPGAPAVTHEFAESSKSPLGLGRTGQFPNSAVSIFRQKTAQIGELSGQLKPEELEAGDIEHMNESGIRSMLGTPIPSDVLHSGLVIALTDAKERQWTAIEVELLEAVAEQAAIALKHAETYGQLRDQLFKIDVIGNLTQQLTEALEVVVRSGKGHGPDTSKIKSPPAQLSQREMEVLRLIAQGLANREIAQKLFLTESTVELHASRIRKKLKLKSRTALVKFAYDYNLV